MDLQNEERFQNILKLPITQKSDRAHADWSQVFRLRSLLKYPTPQAKEGKGPEIKTDFPYPSFNPTNRKFVEMYLLSP